MHYRADGTRFPSESGLSFHLHNGTTTNAFCINSGDLMVLSGASWMEAAGRGARRARSHYTVMTSAANLSKVVFAWRSLSNIAIQLSLMESCP